MPRLVSKPVPCTRIVAPAGSRSSAGVTVTFCLLAPSPVRLPEPFGGAAVVVVAGAVVVGAVVVVVVVASVVVVVDSVGSVVVVVVPGAPNDTGTRTSWSAFTAPLPG